tara:strand:- start:5972 stop:6430 length:459 start_codon:yes stop_codon:yes gene_type:complete
MNATNYESVRYFEDVAVGEELPELSMPLDWTTMALQVSGSQDWTPIHHDFDFARESGMHSIFYNTGWTSGMLGRLLSDWAGREGWVQKLSFQMRGMNGNGVTVMAQARVTGKHIEDGQGLVELDISLGNDQAGVTTPGKATVRLPLKQGDSA